MIVSCQFYAHVHKVMLMDCDWWILIRPVFLALRKRDEERKLVYTILTAPFSGGSGGQEPGSNGGGRSTGGGRRGAQYFAIGKVCGGGSPYGSAGCGMFRLPCPPFQ